jgi:pSer/pThr/pTyr-binding forkhead associated (FHA) protein
MTLPAASAGGGSVGWLVERRNGQQGQRFQLSPGETTIGRDPSNDVVLTDGGVSRQHAAITYVNGVHTIRDLDAANGVLVNGKAIRSQRLRPGDEITIGGSVLAFGVLPEGMG